MMYKYTHIFIGRAKKKSTYIFKLKGVINKKKINTTKRTMTDCQKRPRFL